MKHSLIQLSKRQLLLSSVMATAFVVGAPQQSFAGVNVVNSVQQTGVVKGQVVDSNGEPIIGATIKVKGEKSGTVSDLDGNFEISNDGGGTLVIS